MREPQLSHEQEQEICGLLQRHEAELTQIVTDAVICCQQQLVTELNQKMYRQLLEHIPPTGYFYAVLLQDIFSKMHQGDREVAQAITDNMQNLVSTL